MKHSYEYNGINFIAVWSKEVNNLINNITGIKAKSFATHHNIILAFINDYFFEGKGNLTKDFKQRGKIYPDLKVPIESKEKSHKIIELKTHTSELKYLRSELKERDKIFASSDYFYYS